MNIIESSKEIFDIQISELSKVKNRIGHEIEELCNMIISTKGKIVITGIGKSGIIGKKIAATLASTGTNSVFMNSAEALHGDLGIVQENDMVIAISNSGESEEIINIIPSIKKIGAMLISFTGNSKSRLGLESDLIIDIGVEQEACPMNLAPTCSTTATLVMGDTIASLLIRIRNFKPENFALYHPGGSLGRRLLSRVKDIMFKDEILPLVSPESTSKQVLFEFTRTRLGGACVVDDNRKLLGIITEGDIRRALEKDDSFFELKAESLMCLNPVVLRDKDSLLVDALKIMKENKLSLLPVLDGGKVIGVTRINDLLDFG